jgi:hypothetical protein
MADLYDSLFPPDEASEPRIPVHPFSAGLREYANGIFTRAQVKSALALDVEAEPEFDNLCNRIDAETGLAREKYLIDLHSILLIADSGHAYQTKSALMTRINSL